MRKYQRWKPFIWNYIATRTLFILCFSLLMFFVHAMLSATYYDSRHIPEVLNEKGREVFAAFKICYFSGVILCLFIPVNRVRRKNSLVDIQLYGYKIVPFEQYSKLLQCEEKTLFFRLKHDTYQYWNIASHRRHHKNQTIYIYNDDLVILYILEQIYGAIILYDPYGNQLGYFRHHRIIDPDYFGYKINIYLDGKPHFYVFSADPTTTNWNVKKGPLIESAHHSWQIFDHSVLHQLRKVDDSYIAIYNHLEEEMAKFHQTSFLEFQIDFSTQNDFLETMSVALCYLLYYSNSLH